MNAIEKIALENDLNKLKTYFNPKYVNIYRIPLKPGCSYCLKFVVNAPSYVVHSNEQTEPTRVSSVTFFMDIYSGYPAKKPRVYYGDTSWLYHINVFSDSHSQCTDRWVNGNSNLCELAEKTVRAIVFDKSVRRYNSMATSGPEKWMRIMEEKNKLPTMDFTLLLRRYQRRQPKRA